MAMAAMAVVVMMGSSGGSGDDHGGLPDRVHLDHAAFFQPANVTGPPLAVSTVPCQGATRWFG